MMSSLNRLGQPNEMTSPPIQKSKSNVVGGSSRGNSSNHSMVFDRNDPAEAEDEEESENILDDSEIKPRIEFVSGRHGKFDTPALLIFDSRPSYTLYLTLFRG